MGTRAAFSITAPAKVNLFLRVGPSQPNGYHDIFSIAQQISLADQLWVTSRRRGITLTATGGALPPGRANLVVKAAELLQHAAGVVRGAELRLTKRIPIGAGLGGGSSDAAATAVVLNRLWRLGWSRRQLADTLAPLGSDISLFLVAPTVVIEGRGEHAHALSGQRGVFAGDSTSSFVIVYPDVSVSTAWAYRALDRWRQRLGASMTGATGRQTVPLTPRAREIIISRFRRTICYSSPGPLLDNNFQPMIRSTFPVVVEVSWLLKRSGARGVLLSGSGSAVFGLFHSSARARNAARALGCAHPNWGIWVARPLRALPAVRSLSMPK